MDLPSVSPNLLAQKARARWARSAEGPWLAWTFSTAAAYTYPLAQWALSVRLRRRAPRQPPCGRGVFLPTPHTPPILIFTLAACGGRGGGSGFARSGGLSRTSTQAAASAAGAAAESPAHVFWGRVHVGAVMWDVVRARPRHDFVHARAGGPNPAPGTGMGVHFAMGLTMPPLSFCGNERGGKRSRKIEKQLAPQGLYMFGRPMFCLGIRTRQSTHPPSHPPTHTAQGGCWQPAAPATGWGWRRVRGPGR